VMAHARQAPHRYPEVLANGGKGAAEPGLPEARYWTTPCSPTPFLMFTAPPDGDDFGTALTTATAGMGHPPRWHPAELMQDAFPEVVRDERGPLSGQGSGTREVAGSPRRGRSASGSGWCSTGAWLPGRLRPLRPGCFRKLRPVPSPARHPAQSILPVPRTNHPVETPRRYP
jgi:hypothetical protein